MVSERSKRRDLLACGRKSEEKRGIIGAYSQRRPSELTIYRFPVHKTTGWKSRKWALWMKFDIVGDGPTRKQFQIRWSNQNEQKKYINWNDTPFSKTLPRWTVTNRLTFQIITPRHNFIQILSITHLLMTGLRNNVNPSSSCHVTIRPGIFWENNLLTLDTT